MGRLCQAVAPVRMQRDDLRPQQRQQTSSEIPTPASLAGVPRPEALCSSAIITPSFATLALSVSKQDLRAEGFPLHSFNT